MTPEHTMTGAARLREALQRIALIGKVAAEGSAANGYVGAADLWRETEQIAREALAAVPEAPEPVYDYLVSGQRPDLSGPIRWPEGNLRHAELRAGVMRRTGHTKVVIERRTPGIAPGPWERVEETPCAKCKGRRVVTGTADGGGATDGPFLYDMPCPDCGERVEEGTER